MSMGKLLGKETFNVYESYAQLNVAFFPTEYDKNYREKLPQKLKPKL